MVITLIISVMVLIGIVLIAFAYLASKMLTATINSTERAIEGLENGIRHDRDQHAQQLEVFAASLSEAMTKSIEAIGKAGYGSNGNTETHADDSHDAYTEIPYPLMDWTDSLEDVPSPIDHENTAGLRPGQGIPGIVLDDEGGNGGNGGIGYGGEHSLNGRGGMPPRPNLAGEAWHGE